MLDLWYESVNFEAGNGTTTPASAGVVLRAVAQVQRAGVKG